VITFVLSFLHLVSIYLQTTPEISTVASSSAGILIADIHGSIHLLNRDFEVTRSWIAHTRGRVTHMAERKGVLVTLGVRYRAPPHTIGMVIHLFIGGRRSQISIAQNLGPREQR